MGVTNPGFLLLTAFIGAVLLFYMFRKQYEKMIIPSNLLWEQVMNEWQASPWLNKLQRNLLLLLQLMILSLLMLALVHPIIKTKGIPGEHLLFVIDDSASMAAIHNEMTRFEEAKSDLNEYINQMDDQEITLISAGREPHLLLNKETDKKVIRQVVNELELSYEHSDMKKAIRLADSLANAEDSSLYIFSDSLKQEELTHLPETLPVTVVNHGENGPNLAIKSFGIGMEDKQISAVVLIENQINQQEAVELQVLSDKDILFSDTISIEAKEEKMIAIPDLPQKDYYKAQILVEDDYQVDNQMIAIHQVPFSKIYALGDVSPFVLKGLENIGYDVIQLDSATQEMDLTDGMVVTENIGVQDWPDRPILAITPEQHEKVPLSEQITVTNDPLFQYVDFDKTFIQSVDRTEAALSLPVIAESEGFPLIQKGILNDTASIVIHFPIEESDWPLRPGFPIFLYHAVQWLSSQDAFLGFFQPGEEKWMNVKKETAQWKLFNEEGEFIRTYSLDKESFVAPRKPGLYQIMVQDKKKYLAVQLDDREKSIPFQPSFHVQHGEDNGKKIKQANERLYDKGWFWLAFGALILLFVEWEVTRRGTRV
ncbi:VWA domain-containing protein [Lederbergia sp. NSJ-179]|uniref:vWA domain-containing protein n=1 Tax=Lederbergia sp. NSJ-179 TaxID=2931402 RepID=UPI001FD180FA|nr:VWA domain-containing protein [Lederbergia sp. NSJ-179]MCJ7841700.1 VWA domain-containing protein [Lederbergia sp. NSJ-179]